MNKALARAHSIAAKHRADRGIAGTECRAFRADASPQRGELFIYGLIGSGFFGEGIGAQAVAAALGELKGVAVLDIRMSSEGGDVFEAAAIYSQLSRFPATKNLYVDGIAASAATFIAMAADKIVMSPAAMWMVHNPWTIAVGESVDLRALADRLDLEAQNIAERYAAKTGEPVARMRELMSAETWLNAAQTVEEGFADEVAQVEAPAESAPADANLSRLLAGAERTTSLISPAAVLQARAAMHNLRGAGPASHAAGRGTPAVPEK